MRKLMCLITAIFILTSSNVYAGTKGKVIGAGSGILAGLGLASFLGPIGVVPYGIGVTFCWMAGIGAVAGGGVGYATGDVVEESFFKPKPKKRCRNHAWSMKYNRSNHLRLAYHKRPWWKKIL